MTSSPPVFEEEEDQEECQEVPVVQAVELPMPQNQNATQEAPQPAPQPEGWMRWLFGSCTLL
jgi:hypothetical protein